MPEFIFQGFTERTHLDAIRELLALPQINRVIVSVAFVNAAGVEKIEAALAANASHTVVFAGVRNEITSYQGLARLLVTKCKLFTVDTGSRMLTYHPKLFLVRNTHRVQVILGSANLTLGGLNNNIETGVKLSLNLALQSTKAAISHIFSHFDGLVAAYPKNIREIATKAALDDLMDRGLLIDETDKSPPQPATSAKATANNKAPIPKIKLKVPPLYSTIAKPAKPTPKPKKLPANAAIPTSGLEFELVWQSKSLTRRDLSIPVAANTHATGSVNLDKGLLPPQVDHRHYFREDVFTALTWTQKVTTEEAFGTFDLVLQGVSYGTFTLRIGHTMGTSNAGYKQNNAMTRLSWGPMKQYVAKQGYIGMTLSLYRDKADPARFRLSID